MTIKPYYKLSKTKPYLLVVYGEHNAIYNRDYQMVATDIDINDLRAYIVARQIDAREGFKLTLPEQQPDWIEGAEKAKVLCYWLFNDSTGVREMKRIPMDI